MCNESLEEGGGELGRDERSIDPNMDGRLKNSHTTCRGVRAEARWRRRGRGHIEKLAEIIGKIRRILMESLVVIYAGRKLASLLAIK